MPFFSAQQLHFEVYLVLDIKIRSSKKKMLLRKKPHLYFPFIYVGNEKDLFYSGKIYLSYIY